ncbi:hypothetical protein PSTT_16162 [Puccinia striiformis]|uniref:Tet-like 2OG-Fe(II) oxygenase domain-containing protein n=1 Tax=Puccinia striiformis TaxID=27350 RepID=A0A2S4UE83_9BASI|nr:hypothetical protein PSTT_16162 [Puccinia striiformis]
MLKLMDSNKLRTFDRVFAPIKTAILKNSPVKVLIVENSTVNQRTLVAVHPFEKTLSLGHQPIFKRLLFLKTLLKIPDDGDYRKSIPIRNIMKSNARRKRRQNNRHSEYSLEIQASGINELQQAEDIVDTFHSFDHGKVIVIDKENDGKIIAVIEFIPIDQLSDAEKKEIKFVTTFLHQSKKFVNPVGRSRGWGGKMWAVGWRKCMKALEIIGRYIKYFAVRASPKEYCQHVSKASKVSKILGKMFKNMADIPFETNRQIMKDNEIPSFSSSEFNSRLSKLDCAPHITFTTHGFFNPPHTEG